MSPLKHIAIIPDGNRRWAKAHRLNPWEGHTEGAKRFWEVAESAHEMGVEFLTIWAGSYDNLNKRSKIEVNFLFKLLREQITNPAVLDRFTKNQTNVRILGEWRKFVDKKTAHLVDGLENKTSSFKKTKLTLLFGYDGQREMLSAISSLQEDSKPITGSNLKKHLWTGYLPEVDLVIRTGGEPHWSAGFMMWHTANSQFYFTEQLWPDFMKIEFKKAIAEYTRRERRLGK